MARFAGTLPQGLAFLFPHSTMKCNTLEVVGVLQTAGGWMTISMSHITMENSHAQVLPPAGLRGTMPDQGPAVEGIFDAQHRR